jgi:ergothioneine biosynthesis protein EgtB
MQDASPPKWHLAHVTWFFETFLLKDNLPDYRPYNDLFEVLFNSYYNGIGQQHPRAKRGLLSRPTVAEILDYRQHVDAAMERLFESNLSSDTRFRVTLGLNHEQQHQELLLTDIKYNLGNNPLFPEYAACRPRSTAQIATPMEFIPVSGGVHEVGIDRGIDPNRASFSFDNESPRHAVMLRDFQIAGRLVTNAEYAEFITDGGYQKPELWLSDAWSLIQQAGIDGPLYWQGKDSDFCEYTLQGLHPIEPCAPVCHVSGYEADAFSRWAGCRLPTESEWEIMARGAGVEGNFADSAHFHPQAAAGSPGLKQVFGDTWEWTRSSYEPYPGFTEFAGALGEYNGKFMANQWVLRGGSCATSMDHMRLTYRNFFYPKDRWQFTGIRLARDQ